MQLMQIAVAVGGLQPRQPLLLTLRRQQWATRDQRKRLHIPDWLLLHGLRWRKWDTVRVGGIGLRDPGLPLQASAADRSRSIRRRRRRSALPCLLSGAAGVPGPGPAQPQDVALPPHTTGQSSITASPLTTLIAQQHTATESTQALARQVATLTTLVQD
ncbi:hypothetical protein ON010_g13589 [Phytophthora cinnamomi]|nr:hypothetical protein ON010_g13589 [Phytophthora cinnamomi]